MLLVCEVRFPMVAGVAASLSSTINPLSTNFRIVRRRKDHGGCGYSCWWSCGFRFCLIWWQTSSGLTVCPLSLFSVVGWYGGGVSIEVEWGFGRGFLDSNLVS